MRKLKQILKGITGYSLYGSDELIITGISSHSKSLLPGHLFIARKGGKHDGRAFIQEALIGGASAIVTDLYNPSLKGITQIVYPEVASIEGLLAANYYQHPARELLLVGITGTNGKTSTAYLAHQLLESLHGRCGMIGTIGYRVGAHCYPASHTTPNATTTHRLLREMVSSGCKAAVMEVTSHALDQRRVDQLSFDVAAFTNLTADHLDYHGSLVAYAAAKKRLFDSLEADRWAIVNHDHEWSAEMLRGCHARCLSYGLNEGADVCASHLYFSSSSTRCHITYQGITQPACWPLVGQFNVYNCLAALAICLSQGLSLTSLISSLASLTPIPGRLQQIDNPLGFSLYVDFAHSEDALDNVLSTLRHSLHPQGKLIVVFGCGGDRDRHKRPRMAAVAERYASLSLITTDNPRSENPIAICDEIAAGFSNQAHYEIELDRKTAIRKALLYATSYDTVLIAGRGHEQTQMFTHQSIPFDDARISRDLCLELASQRVIACSI